MTVPAIATNEVLYVENGGSGPYAYPYRYLVATDLEVRRRLANDLDFEPVTGWSVNGANVSLVSGVDGATLSIRRNTAIQQPTSYPPLQDFPAQSNELALDRLAMIAQDQESRLDRSDAQSVRVPEGSQAPALDITGLVAGDILQYLDGKLQRLDRAPFAGKLYGGDATGAMVPLSGTGADSALRTDMATAIGAYLMGYQAPGVDFIQSVYSKLQQTYSFADAGCVGDGIADDTVAAQKAIDHCVENGLELRHTGGIIRTTAPLNIYGGVTIRGCGGAPYRTTITSTWQNGSWFLPDHPGKGFKVGNGELLSGIRLFEFGMVRKQPIPAADKDADGNALAAVAYVPGDFDYDIDIDNADVIIHEVTLLNATKGIHLADGNAGRLTIGTLRGQPLTVGINIENSLDIFTAQFIDFWPYWQNNMNVHNWTVANRDDIWLQRVDGPMLTTVFGIFSRSVLRCSQNSSGKTTKMMVGKLYADGGKNALWIDNTAAAVIGQIGMMAGQALEGVAGSQTVLIEGANCQIDITSFRCDLADQAAISMIGANNYVQLASASVNNWNKGGTGAAAFTLANSNTLRIPNRPISSGGGGAPVYSATGTFDAPDAWSTYIPAITSTGGAVALGGTPDCRYQVRGNMCEIFLVLPGTTGGSGGLLMQLPFPPTASGVAMARETAVSGSALTIQISEGNSQASIQTYNNQYAGGAGTRIVGSIRYRI